MDHPVLNSVYNMRSLAHFAQTCLHYSFLPRPPAAILNPFFLLPNGGAASFFSLLSVIPIVRSFSLFLVINSIEESISDQNRQRWP